MKVCVLSLGGSIIVPDSVDTFFLFSFSKAIDLYLSENNENALVIVCGGGSVARKYQTALNQIVQSDSASCLNSSLDLIGIRATYLNAELVKAVLGSLCKDPIVTNPTSDKIKFTGRVLVAGGWKPGFSTDTDAVYLASKFHSPVVVNLSNISKVYTADPKKDPDAKPIDSVSWEDFRKMVGNKWEPGKNLPFDPIASDLAQKLKIKVICADGRNIQNTINILKGKSFEGTVIG